MPRVMRYDLLIIMGSRPAAAKPRVTAVAILAAFSALIGGCEDQRVPDAVAEAIRKDISEQKLIAMVAAGRDDPLWPILKHSAQRYADAAGKVRFEFIEPAGNSPNDQLRAIRSLSDPMLRGVCIQPTDVAAISPELQRLQNRGIAIVSMIQPLPDDLRVAHVGFDASEIGVALADATAEALGGTGSIMVLHAGPNHDVYGPRYLAFATRMRRYSKIEVFADVNCDATPRRARELIQERSARYPRLSAWVAMDDWPLQLLSAGDEPLPEAVRLITFGGLPHQWPLIRRGVIPVCVAVNYNDLGKEAALSCHLAALGKPALHSIHKASLRTITANNLDAYIRDWAFWSQGRMENTTPPR